MDLRGIAFLASTTLALLSIPACGARGGGPIAETDGGAPGDAPAAVDTGFTPVDTGFTPTDTGFTPVDTGGPPACAAPRRVCDGACVDIRTDLAHCGSCGRECAAGQFCSGGSCRSTSECAAPRMTCGESCIDITADVFNCGACSRRCGAGQTCTGSRCVGGTPTCPSPTRLCGARCIDVGGDPANCGACGRTCAPGTTCTRGACVAVATGIAAGGPCTGETCGPTGELECAALTSGGYCTGFCATGSTASEQGECGGAGSTCVAHPPFANVPAGQGICTRACNPAATGEASGGCRSGQVCTGFWYSTPSGSAQDSPGCFPHCQTDAQCAGVVASGGASAMRCNTRTGRCGPAAADLSLRFDGDACNPAEVMATSRPVCRGLCFRVDSDSTHGICGSYLDLGVGTNCPDNPTLIRPVAPGNDNAAICVFKNCARNSECASPLRCVYPESAGAVRMDVASRCAYASALQPAGIP